MESGSKGELPHIMISCSNMPSERGKVREGEKGKRKRSKANSILDIVPREIMLNILVRVASNSLTDLCNVKLSCKELNNLGSDDCVYQHATLERIVISPRYPPELASFLLHCEESGNPEALYIHGMVEYFKKKQALAACEVLKKAAKLGHEEAIYVLGIILISRMDDESTHEGMSVLNELETKLSKVELAKLRERCAVALSELSPTESVWRERPICLDTRCILTKRNPANDWDNGYIYYCGRCRYGYLRDFSQILRPVRREKPFCSDKECRMSKANSCAVVNEWEDDFSFNCDACKWDHELTRFEKMQEGYGLAGYYV